MTNKKRVHQLLRKKKRKSP